MHPLLRLVVTDLKTAVASGGLGGDFTVNSDTKITVTAGAGGNKRSSNRNGCRWECD